MVPKTTVYHVLSIFDRNSTSYLVKAGEYSPITRKLLFETLFRGEGWLPLKIKGKLFIRVNVRSEQRPNELKRMPLFVCMSIRKDGGSREDEESEGRERVEREAGKDREERLGQCLSSRRRDCRPEPRGGVISSRISWGKSLRDTLNASYGSRTSSGQRKRKKQPSLEWTRRLSWISIAAQLRVTTACIATTPRATISQELLSCVVTFTFHPLYLRLVLLSKT